MAKRAQADPQMCPAGRPSSQLKEMSKKRNIYTSENTHKVHAPTNAGAVWQAATTYRHTLLGDPGARHSQTHGAEFERMLMIFRTHRGCVEDI